MSVPRLATGLMAGALIRRAQAEGGTAAVLHRGDADAGGLIAILAQHGVIADIFERGHDLEGRQYWRRVLDKTLQSSEKIDEYVVRRRSRDGDLWIIELDIADSERFAAEMTAMG